MPGNSSLEQWTQSILAQEDAIMDENRDGHSTEHLVLQVSLSKCIFNECCIELY